MVIDLLLSQVQPHDAGLLFGVPHSLLLPHKTLWQCRVHSCQLCQYGCQNSLQVKSPTSACGGQWPLCFKLLFFFSGRYIHSFFAPTPHRPLYDAIPHRHTFLFFAAAFVSTAASEVSSLVDVHCTARERANNSCDPYQRVPD